MTKTTVAVVVNKIIFAPPQRVYDAWLIPQNASKWLFATPSLHLQGAQVLGRGDCAAPTAEGWSKMQQGLAKEATI